LYRGIREHLPDLLGTLAVKELSDMKLGLSHSTSRHNIQFSPDKVDTMVIHAVALIDDLDKELNSYTMRCKEWYGYHFPEMKDIVTDSLQFAKVVKAMSMYCHVLKTVILVNFLCENQFLMFHTIYKRYSCISSHGRFL